MKINYLKSVVTAFAGLLSSVLGILYIPVLLMVTCNVIDYVTGLMAAVNRPEGGICSYKSMRGIIKKITMWLLVVVGAVIDELILYATETIGYQFPLPFLVACVVAIWIICNELISILENMVDIGIKIPVFLIPLVNNLKTTIDHMGNTSDAEKEKNTE